MTGAALLGIPLGGAGSGRQRYATAMTLHARGLLSDATLEAYRVASPHDNQPPHLFLQERDLPMPESWPDNSGQPAAF